MRRPTLLLLLFVFACGNSSQDVSAACEALEAGAWSSQDTRQELIAKVAASADAYEVFVQVTDGDIQADFTALADTFTNFSGYLNDDANVGYDQLISQVDVETVRQSGRTIEYLDANC